MPRIRVQQRLYPDSERNGHRRAERRMGSRCSLTSSAQSSTLPIRMPYNLTLPSPGDEEEGTNGTHLVLHTDCIPVASAQAVRGRTRGAVCGAAAAGNA